MNLFTTELSATRKYTALLAWLLICFTCAGIGAIASVSAPAFYTQLVRPDWAPPASLFAPVWTTLYVLMAIAAWLVWCRRTNGNNKPALLVFIIQLILNAQWTWVFFDWQQGALSFACIVVLWCLIAGTILLFWRLRPVAALLLLPYLAWVTFATALTWSVWQANPQLLG